MKPFANIIAEETYKGCILYTVPNGTDFQQTHALLNGEPFKSSISKIGGDSIEKVKAKIDEAQKK